MQFVFAIYDFESQQADDLPFKAGDKIKIVDSSDRDWWKGELNGRIGLFPSNYVEDRESNSNYYITL